MPQALDGTLHPSIKRCAIYTRKSTDRGLDQDFNSLKAQQAICSAYIASQSHRGWVLSEKIYEDAAESGATLDRPAMNELLADLERGRIDVVVVYKLDRLSRSLLDFVRLMDVFKRYDVSFACITQNFDTDDSLGRLVMNVLLTFAQFEREMTGDRIRDKRRAMVLKGLWSGGRPPIGYDLVKHQLVVNRSEAEIVRFVFDQFLETRNMAAVQRACERRGYHSKTYLPHTGILQVGVPLREVSVRKILMNPVYAGYLLSNGVKYPGIHQPIISRESWQQVDEIRRNQIAARAVAAPKALLNGLLHDSFGRSMTINYTHKSRKICTYYRSNQNAWGCRNRVPRLGAPGPITEQLVVCALQDLLTDRERLRALLIDLGRYGPELRRAGQSGEIASRRLEALSRDQLRSVLQGLIVRIEISRERMKIVTRALEYENLLNWDFIGLFCRRTEDANRAPTFLIDVPCAGEMRLQRRLRLPITERKSQTYRINKQLRNAITEVRRAWTLIEENRDLPLTEIAKRIHKNTTYLMRLLRLTYLAPDIVTAIMDGAQPRSMTRRALIEANLPLDWALQRKLFGFPEQPPIQTCDAHY
jgi:DNA invertase Pin-like site-specific DNA recombinase